MAEQRDPTTLTDDEILTRRVDGGKQAWEAPRVTELSIGVSAGGTGGFTEDDASDDGGGSAPS
jgi:hypothetical protein